MKAIVNTAKGQLAMRELPMPEPAAGQVRIRTAACGICATDIEMIDGSLRGKYPQVLGHEWSGTVEKCGSGVSPAWMGKSCVAENVLRDGGEVGFEHPGGYGEFFVTDVANVHLLPDGFPLDTAALLEPLAVAVRGMARLRAFSGPALILGDGPIGLFMLMLLKRAGTGEIGLVGGRDARLQLAQQLNATWTVNYHTVELSLADEIVRHATGKFAAIVEATRSADVMPLAVRVAANGARILLIGSYEGQQTMFAPDDFIHHEFELIASNASAGAWPEAVNLAVGRELQLEKLITHRFPTTEFASAIQTARNDRSALRVILQWRQK